MKFLATLVVLPSVAFAATVGPLPQSDCADTEVSTNLPFQADFATMSRIEFTLSLVASTSNVVEVSIGTDVNADGILSIDETDQTIGYNCGRWFRRDSVSDEVKAEGQGQLWNSRIEKTFIVKKRSLDQSWNLTKVVRRGVAEVGEVVLVEGKQPGVFLMVR